MKNTIYLILITVCLAIIFAFYPEIDITVSKLFFSSFYNQFYLKNNLILITVDKLSYLILFLFLFYNCMLILKKFNKTKSLNPYLYKSEVFILLIFLLGSVVLVQAFSKHYFGRARPIEVQEFGGELKFTPAFQISNQCKYNCSFVSFHTSIGILFIAYAMIQIGRKKTLLMTLAIFATILIGLTRIMQGQHFLSDIIFSVCLMLAIIYILSFILKVSLCSKATQ